MRVLIGCETSGIVRRAFLAMGHDAWSCDLRPSDDRSNRHIIGDIRNHLNDGWDLLAVMHPPCTRLCNSGVRWLTEPPKQLKSHDYDEATRLWYQRQDRDGRLKFMWRSLEQGAELFSACWNAPIPRKAVENPVMHGHAKKLIRNYKAPAQFAQPHWFGDPVFKSIGLYLENLPPLVPTNPLTPPAPGTDEHRAWSKIHRMPEGPNRSKERSRFFPGIAAAMADQWGGIASEVRAA